VPSQSSRCSRAGQLGGGDLAQQGDGQAAALDGQLLQVLVLERTEAEAVSAADAELFEVGIGLEQRRHVRLLDPGNLVFFLGNVTQKQVLEVGQLVAGGNQRLDNGGGILLPLVAPVADDQSLGHRRGGFGQEGGQILGKGDLLLFLRVVGAPHPVNHGQGADEGTLPGGLWCRRGPCVGHADVALVDLFADQVLVRFMRRLRRPELLGLRLAGGAEAAKLDRVAGAVQRDGPELLRAALDELILAPRDVPTQDDAHVRIVVLDREARELFEMVADAHGRMRSAGVRGRGRAYAAHSPTAM
jgi:hypothetical protein